MPLSLPHCVTLGKLLGFSGPQSLERCHVVLVQIPQVHLRSVVRAAQREPLPFVVDIVVIRGSETWANRPKWGATVRDGAFQGEPSKDSFRWASDLVLASITRAYPWHWARGCWQQSPSSPL